MTELIIVSLIGVVIIGYLIVQITYKRVSISKGILNIWESILKEPWLLKDFWREVHTPFNASHQYSFKWVEFKFIYGWRPTWILSIEWYSNLTTEDSAYLSRIVRNVKEDRIKERIK